MSEMLEELVEAAARAPAIQSCAVVGCVKPIFCREWCQSHYTRWLRYGDPMFLRKAPNGTVLAWLKAAVACQSDECLLWPFAKCTKGYAQIHFDGRAQNASRVMCFFVHGPAPSDGHVAAHDCGNGALGCVNPRHLRWATAIENEADKIIHGTASKGEKHGGAKLTASNVQEIRCRLATGESLSQIAADYEVSSQTISSIRSGARWRSTVTYSPAIRKDAREMMEKPESWYCEQCAITDLRHTIKCFEDDADDELGCCESCGQPFKDEDDSLSMGEVYFCRKCAAEWKAEYDACQHEWGEPDPHWGDQRICNKCGGYEPEMPALTEQEKAPPGGR